MRNKSIRNAFCLLCLALMSLLQFSCSGSSNGGKVVKHVNDLHGAVIGVQLGTTSDVLATSLEDKGDGTKVERFTKSADAIQALTQGKIDCMVEDEQPAKAFLRLNPSLEILPDEFGHSSLAICVAKGNEDLQMKINEAIELLRKSGVIDSIVRRHIDRNIAVAYQPGECHLATSKLAKDSSVGSASSPSTLRFSTNAAFEPFEYYDNGKIVGIDIDVARAICDVLHMKCEIVDMEFDAVITSVQTGKADAGIAGITVTPERKKNINFTDSYTDVRQAVIVNGGSITPAKQSLAEQFETCFVTGNRYQYLLKGLGNTDRKSVV